MVDFLIYLPTGKQLNLEKLYTLYQRDREANQLPKEVDSYVYPMYILFLCVSSEFPRNNFFK